MVVGVGGEIQFSRIGFRRQQELTRRSRHELAETQAELIRIKATRRQILGRLGNADSFVDGIKAFAGTKFDIGHAREDREQWDFLWDIEPLFNRAGWVFVDWQGPQAFGKINWLGQHVYGVANVLNVEVEVAPSSLAKLTPAARALVETLNKIGIEATPPGDRMVSTTSVNADVVHFLVGAKR